MKKEIENQVHEIILENSIDLKIFDKNQNLNSIQYEKVFQEIKIEIYKGISKSIKNNKQMKKQIKKLRTALKNQTYEKITKEIEKC
jgi:RNase P/RNase MRP subunit p30